MVSNGFVQSYAACMGEVGYCENIQVQSAAIDNVELEGSEDSRMYDSVHDIVIVFPLKRSHIGVVELEAGANVGQKYAERREPSSLEVRKGSIDILEDGFAKAGLVLCPSDRNSKEATSLVVGAPMFQKQEDLSLALKSIPTDKS